VLDTVPPKQKVLPPTSACNQYVRTFWQTIIFYDSTRLGFRKKCFFQEMWEDSADVLRQLPGIGHVLAKTLTQAGIIGFEDARKTDTFRLEAVLCIP